MNSEENKEKILVTQSSMPQLEEYTEEIKSIFGNKWLTNMGEKHKKLEEELIEYLKVKNITLFCNGHLALDCAIKSLHMQGEVITTPFTFISTTHAITQNGLKPVFCDIEDENYTMDASKIEELITDKTCAIVPVHVYGNVCEVEKIEEIAKKYNLKVIYDAAHAFGVEYKQIGIGNFGDMSMFSFHATKVFNTIEGGAVSCNNDKKKQLDLLKNFGITGPQTAPEIGLNAKMNEFQAAMGICNMRHIQEEILKRKRVVEEYRKRLGNIPGIKLNKEQENVKTNYAYFPVVIEEKVFGKNRDIIVEELAKKNIFTRKYFYPLITDFECYSSCYNSQETPVAKYISDRILTLPLYADLSIEKVNEICDTILTF